MTRGGASANVASCPAGLEHDGLPPETNTGDGIRLRGTRPLLREGGLQTARRLP
jgi:hypothetical protein